MKCKICGANVNLIHNGTRDNPIVSVYKCSSCNTKQLDTENINLCYEGGVMNNKIGMSDYEIQQRLLNCQNDDKRRCDYMIPYVKDKRVLDFGCGFGGYISHIKDYTKEIAGVDLGTDEQRYLRMQGYNVKSKLNEFNKKWDVISLFHVFEHLDNPNMWLNDFSDNLEDDGTLAIEVPNANDALLEFYECKEFEKFTYWSLHLFLYTVDSFTYLVNKNEKFVLSKVEQIQRYPLSNHLYWLSHGLPGGQNVYDMFNDDILCNRYKEILAQNDMCDTLLFILKKRR